MSETIKVGIKLLLITVIATFALALTQMVTKEPIRAQIENAAVEARQAVLADAEEFKALEVSNSEYPSILEVHEGLADGKTVGYTFKLAGKGFGGTLEIIAGINAEGTLEGVRILRHSETPGLGAESQKPAFYEQYTGKSASEPLGDGDINAITGATITSKAVTGTVNAAIEYYNAELGGGKQ
jgi:electron transport complex protein RnfG